MHYSKFKKLLSKKFNEISFCELSILNLAQNANAKEIYKYLFVMSDNYKFYLDYVKKYCGNDKYYNEIRTNKILLKKIKTNRSNSLENELRENFILELSRI